MNMPENIEKFHVVGMLTILLVVGVPVAAFFYDAHKSSFSAREVLLSKPADIDRETYKSSGAIAWGDYDNDGDDDMAVASLAHSVILLENREGAFHDVTVEAQLHTQKIANANAIYFADYNNDSCLDLLVISGHADTLFKNNCDNTFSDVSDTTLPERDVFTGDSGFSAAWGDYNNDSFLDIYVAHYQSDVPNALLRNNGDGTFDDVTKQSGASGEAQCGEFLRVSQRKNSLQPVWLDYNQDGLLDLFVANDSRSFSPLYTNNGNGTFTDSTMELGLCKRADAMGVAVGDYDNDLDLDIYVTNAGANLLWEQQNDGTFVDVAGLRGVADNETLGWGAVFLDYDNDADLDLYVVNGDVKFRSGAKAHHGADRTNRLFKNEGETFTDVAYRAWAFSKVPERGVALSDYNKDGTVDLLVGRDGLFKSNNPLLITGKPTSNNWLAVTLMGTTSNSHGIGATIFVSTDSKTQVRHIASGDSFTAQHSYTQYFGLGEEDSTVNVRILWPGGKEQEITNVHVSNYLEVQESE